MKGATGSLSDPLGRVGGATALCGYLRSGLRDQQPEILAPAPSSMSASYDNLLSSSVAVEMEQPSGSAPTGLGD